MGDQDVTGPLGGSRPQAHAAPPANVPAMSGGKVTVDFGEANQALVHLQNAWDSLKTASQQIDRLVRGGIQAPGHDSHSMVFAGQNDPVVSSVKSTLDKHLSDVEAQYNNLKASLEQYSQNELGNKGNFDNLK